MSEIGRNKSRKLWLWIPLVIIGIVVLSVGIYAAFLYTSTKNVVDNIMHDPIKTIDTDLTKKKLKETTRINVLLLGIDASDSEKGRSDAMIVMQLDPKTDEMRLISIPRDVRTEIAGKDMLDKINHAYAFGGAAMSIATVENFLNIEIDYFVSINMDGLIELVDELETITVYNEVAWSDGSYDFPKGEVELDGDKTLVFVRMRKQDPLGDFGRTMRQRKVIEGIMQKGATVGSIPKFTRIVDVLGYNMATNMDFEDMKQLFGSYKETRKNITEYMISGTGERIDDIYYLIVQEKEREKVHQMLSKE